MEMAIQEGDASGYMTALPTRLTVNCALSTHNVTEIRNKDDKRFSPR